MQYRVIKNVEQSWLDTLSDELCRTGLPMEVRDVYKGRNRVVAFQPPLAEAEVNIKAFRRPIVVNRMAYGWLRKSKARRSYEHALKLRELGIGTPLPYGYIEEFDSKHFLQQSFYISEQLGPEWKEIRFLEERPDADKITDQLAAWIAAIHSHGVLVKDLSPGNVLMRIDEAGNCSFQLVDINRMSFGCSSRRLMMGKAARLINSEEWMRRFARSYAEAAGLNQSECEQTILTEYYYHQVKLLRKRARKEKLQSRKNENIL